MKTRKSKMEDGGWQAGAVRRSVVWGIHRSKQSKRRGDQPRASLLLRFLGGLLLIGISFSALAQFAINWHTIDGGGGISTGGVYSVSGTIGQPDAEGPMTNGQYSVTGGFWVLPTAIQTEGAPTLTIIAAGAGQAQISWTPDTGTNWVLQETSSLSPPNWMNSTSGSTNPIVVPATVPTMFYRLFNP